MRGDPWSMGGTRVHRVKGVISICYDYSMLTEMYAKARPILARKRWEIHHELQRFTALPELFASLDKWAIVPLSQQRREHILEEPFRRC
jgi:hypothetical protein